MKVVSFVPSLTETLLECDIDVVGRTRYCIHPESKVQNIPIVGGTKNADWSKVFELDVDLVLFDREENTAEMAEQCPLPFIATHVTDLKTLARDLKLLSEKFENMKLADLSARAKKLSDLNFPLNSLHLNIPNLKIWNLEKLNKIENILYIIWRNPWMGVARNTFIGDILEKLGYQIPLFDYRYPVLELSDYKKTDTLLLFSTEPYPFLKHEEEIQKLGFPSAIVDGEHFSWFGIRSIRFLENFSRNSHTL